MRKSLLTGITRIGILVFGLMGLSISAQAVCSGPSGVAGQLQWIAPNVKYCNGSSWVALNNTNTGMGCSVAGQISYVSSEIMYCNGTNWIRSAPTTNYLSCSGTTPGYYYYDTGGTFYWFCNGSNWRRMGP